MKKIALLAVVLSGFLSGCANVEIKKNIQDLEASDKLMIPEYTTLIEKEYASDPAKIENRKKLIESRQHVIDALKKATE